MKDDISQLSQLGSKKTEYKYAHPCKEMLETFRNNFHADYNIHLFIPEFTSLCPKTGQPDFATIKIVYSPSTKCVETKSLKLYMFAWRNEGTFMETITNTIFEDLLSVLAPTYLKIEAAFNARGGIGLTVIRETK